MKRQLVHRIARRLEILAKSDKDHFELRRYHCRASRAEIHELDGILENLICFAEKFSENNYLKQTLVELLADHKPALCQRVESW